ncbi:uncharacterized protein TNCV_2191861 [Trichonephila clavipes]|nr:uncharacterized protein TNCV_2191861 [Trichonephila clavipes]
MPYGRYRAFFDQVSEFTLGRIVVYSDCGLSFREIIQRLGRNQATVLPVCHHWVQEETMNRGGQSHPPRCTTAIEDKRTVCMVVMDHAAASRTTAQQMQSFTHHSVSTRTIRCHLQQNEISARHQFLRLPLTRNPRCLHRQCYDERWTWKTGWNNIVFTDESRFCL